MRSMILMEKLAEVIGCDDEVLNGLRSWMEEGVRWVNRVFKLGKFPLLKLPLQNINYYQITIKFH
jgi:hypothetical protein